MNIILSGGSSASDSPARFACGTLWLHGGHVIIAESFRDGHLYFRYRDMAGGGRMDEARWSRLEPVETTPAEALRYAPVGGHC